MESQILKRICKTKFIQSALNDARRRFAKDESGAVLVFSLTLFILMVMMGGLAVDLMRYETTRTTLQNTLDRSTLAAASLSQTLDPESVVRDYFAKAGISQYLTAVNVDQGLNYRNVHADAKANADPYFLHMIGINKFEAPGNASAEQRISNVEIALILDVSGSMAGTKITNLKSAASEFVSTVLLNDADDRISIGLVPYNGQVNLGSVLAAKYNMTATNGVADANCVDLPSSVYSGTSMSRTLAMTQTAYADTYSTTTQSTSYLATSSGAPTAGNRWCPPSPGNIVRVPTNDISTLQGYINGLTAIGATSINAGLKWGLALLDPASRNMFAELANANKIPAVFAVRPFEYTDDEAMKVIVLMTDGEHFAEERVNDSYKTGNSPIYKGTDNNYSIRHTSGRPTAAGTNEYFVPHLCTSNNCKTGANTSEAWRSTPWSSGVQQSWQKIWADFRVSYVAWQMYERALSKDSTRGATYNTWMANFRSLTPTTTMDTQLQTICSLAKSKKNVVIYGIAFDAPTHGQEMISQCSSGPSYYFSSTPTNIKSAFRAIATNISQLRLTQ
jgi:Flp pilus assembly protein TadG